LSDPHLLAEDVAHCGEVNMSSWLQRSFGYGLRAAVGRAIFGDGGDQNREKAREPIGQQTEEEIRADERRYEEEAKRYEAEARTGRAAKK
jgi:hypothetical protein